MKTHCRCRKCEARKFLPKHPDEYKHQPACGNCGARDWRPDKWKNEQRAAGRHKLDTCRSACLPYPHRRGCRGCLFHKDGSEKDNATIEAELLEGLDGKDLEFAYRDVWGY